MAENSGSKRDSDGPSKQDLIASGKATNDPVSLLKPTAPPVGLRLLHTLTGHTGWVNSVVWSPDGKWLASEDDSKTVQVWDSSTGRLVQTLVGHTDGIYQPVWSPDGKWLVTSSKDKTARIWDPNTGQQVQTLANYMGNFSVIWSPDGKWLAGSDYKIVRIWNPNTGQQVQTLVGHTGMVWSPVWSPDGKWLATSSSDDKTVRIWNPNTGQQIQALVGHTDGISMLVWSPDGKWLAGSDYKTVWVWDSNKGRLVQTLAGGTLVFSVAWSPDGKWLAGSDRQMVRVWDSNTGRLVQILEVPTHTDFSAVHLVVWSPDGKWLAASYGGFPDLPSKRDVCIWRSETWESVAVPTNVKDVSSDTWHPPLLVNRRQNEKGLYIWHLDLEYLLWEARMSEGVHYTNAKVVLVGDSGVGKSGLALVLTQQSFAPTESTHGRHVWVLDQQEVQVDSGPRETREVLLWDLAGQRDYRLIHQLHLHEATVALIVFDAARDTDPFAGIRHWYRALRQAQQARGSVALPLTIFLVAARIDRGGGSISRARIEALLKELDCADYIETSAKDGRGITELGQKVRAAIDWSKLPKVTSTTILRSIKTFMLHEQQAGRLLRTVDELYDAFLRTDSALPQQDTFHQEFEAALGRLEAQGTIRQLGFGQLFLLQPELLDAYASALLIAVKQEPDGLGSIPEVRVQQGDFPVPAEDRLPNATQEKLLLIAMIDELVCHQLVLRESGLLLFPSQSTREHPEQNTLDGQCAVTMAFTGPVLSIYTTLVVRLAHSGVFQKLDFWQHVVTYTTQLGGTYGLFLSPRGEEQAEVGLFFDEAAREEMRFHFEDFIFRHLDRQASGEVQRRRRFVCPSCGETFTETQVRNRRARGFTSIRCSTCDTEVSLLDGEERLATRLASLVESMEEAANDQRDRESAQSILQGKIATQDFDVFLCHHGPDKGVVKQLGEQLKHAGILPWLDEWELRPGLPWQQLLEQQIEHIKAAAVFVGKSGIGPWQHQELDAFLREFVQRGCPVIPVLLPDAPQEPTLPVFLRAMTWVDFRKQDPDPMQRLLWGITGKREMSEEIRGG